MSTLSALEARRLGLRQMYRDHRDTWTERGGEAGRRDRRRARGDADFAQLTVLGPKCPVRSLSGTAATVLPFSAWRSSSGYVEGWGASSKGVNSNARDRSLTRAESTWRVRMSACKNQHENDAGAPRRSLKSKGPPLGP